MGERKDGTGTRVKEEKGKKGQVREWQRNNECGVNEKREIQL